MRVTKGLHSQEEMALSSTGIARLPTVERPAPVLDRRKHWVVDQAGIRRSHAFLQNNTHASEGSDSAGRPEFAEGRPSLGGPKGGHERSNQSICVPQPSNHQFSRGTMEDLLIVLGTLFFMPMVLATAVEAILEVFRGTLERYGVTWAKSKITLEEALDLASEFATDKSALATKLEAVKTTALQFRTTAKDHLAKLTRIRGELEVLQGSEPSGALVAQLNEVANQIKADLQSSERLKIFIMRFVAAAVGCLLVWSSDFYVFQILMVDDEGKRLASLLAGLQGKWINILVGGLAAAAGSSYWHDQMDRVRNLKSAITNAKTLGVKPS
jgi:hypothetical protein